MPDGDLVSALQTAIDAAQEAGQLIRADYHLPAGPRGSGDHADVDIEAEQLIRARPRAAFPDWAYLGEETGRDGPAAATSRWLVDPNDGTRAYLQGYRGSAVSVGLVRAGRPVLGVVFAPCAPDRRSRRRPPPTPAPILADRSAGTGRATLAGRSTSVRRRPMTVGAQPCHANAQPDA